jgi:hypothetical protein
MKNRRKASSAWPREEGGRKALGYRRRLKIVIAIFCRSHFSAANFRRNGPSLRAPAAGLCR